MNEQAFILKPFEIQQIQYLEINLQIFGNIAINGNKLKINYQVIGDLYRIIIPHSSGNLPTRQHELWENTCFEFFLGIKNFPSYWEFNLSPNGNWNIYRFENYRQGMVEETAIQILPFSFKQETNTCLLTLEFDLNTIISPNIILEFSITSVIKLQDESLSYWAINHCGEVADFHQRDSFAIELAN
jgi:hypothetical protein